MLGLIMLSPTYAADLTLILGTLQMLNNIPTLTGNINDDEKALHTFWAPMLELAADVMDDGGRLGHLQVHLWQLFKEELPDYPADSAVSLPKLADRYADKIWYTMPNPSQKFTVAKPVPLKRSDSSASGIEAGVAADIAINTKLVISASAPVPPLPAMLCWEALCTRLPTARVAQLFPLKNLPAGVLAMAAECLELDDPQLLQITAARWFSNVLKNNIDANHPDLVRVLISYGNACTALGIDDLHLNILTRLAMHSNKILRSQVLQQLTALYADRGDFAQAQQSLDAALAANPDDVHLAPLEVTILIKSAQPALAQERASFWLAHHAARQITAPPQVIHLLQTVADGGDGILALANTMTYDLPEWQRRFFHALNKGLIESMDRAGVENHLQIQNADDNTGSSKLVPSAAILALEAQWQRAWPLQKPIDNALLPEQTVPIWEPPQAEIWVSFLENHPQAFNSLEVLDDLRAAFAMMPMAFELEAPVMLPALNTLLQHAEDLLAPVLASNPVLLWRFSENRSALRLMHDYAQTLSEQNTKNGCIAMRRLLRVEPTDQLGVLGNLIEDLIFLRDDAAVVAVTAQFKLVSTPLIFNRIFALYRLGQLELATSELQRAHAANPKVLAWLIPEVKAPPKDHMELTTLGSEEEAWLYREAMHDDWAETPGAIAWLKKALKTP
jgi:tetratricopeptide (TPR) repeat protein